MVTATQSPECKKACTDNMLVKWFSDHYKCGIPLPSPGVGQQPTLFLGGHNDMASAVAPDVRYDTILRQTASV